MKPAKIVLAVLDAFPFGAVQADRTPTLYGLAQEGVYVPSGGEAVLSASTYPNHASLVTGALPSEHGIFFVASKNAKTRISGAHAPSNHGAS